MSDEWTIDIESRIIGEIRLDRTPVLSSHVPFFKLAGWCCEPFGGTQSVLFLDHVGVKEVWRWFRMSRERRFKSRGWDKWGAGDDQVGLINETLLYDEALLDRMQLGLTWGAWAWEHDWHGLGVERYPLSFSVREMCLLDELMREDGGGHGARPWCEEVGHFRRWVAARLRGKDGVMAGAPGMSAWPKMDREYWSSSPDGSYERKVNREWSFRNRPGKPMAPSEEDVAAQLCAGGRLLPAGSSARGLPDAPHRATGLDKG